MRQTSRHAVSIMLLAAAALLAQGLAPAIAAETLDEAGRTAFLAELQPVTLKNCKLKRMGSTYDGGYLVCENLSEGVQSGYSYGVGPNDELGCEISKRYSIPVHEYDCFDPARPTCKGGTFQFNNECLAPKAMRDKQRRVFDTLQHQIEKNGDTGKRLFVKIDIEGAEWDAFLATPDEVFERIDQIPMEMHFFQGVTARHVEAVKKLKKHFYVVNLHYNNFACSSKLKPLKATAFEVLLVNKRLGELDTAAPVPAPMSPLNAPDNPNLPECK